MTHLSLSHTHTHRNNYSAEGGVHPADVSDCMSVRCLCAEVPMRSNTRVPQFFRAGRSGDAAADCQSPMTHRWALLSEKNKNK